MESDRVPLGTAKVLQFHRAAARPNAVSSIEQGGFAADIFHNPEVQPPVFHFILTHSHAVQPAEILYWGQAPTLSGAVDAARNMIAALSAQARAI